MARGNRNKQLTADYTDKISNSAPTRAIRVKKARLATF